MKRCDIVKNIDFKALGIKLREIRVSRGLTQEYVATVANVNTSHISNIENNRVKISLQTLVLVCNALDITVDYALSNEYNCADSSLEREIMKELSLCTTQTTEQILKIVKALQ